MKSSFNVYGAGSVEYNDLATPIWLGNVRPVAIGGTLVAAAIVSGRHYPAGAPVIYDFAAKTIIPFYLEGTTLTAGDGSSTIDSANAYLYNDIYIDDTAESATGSVVVSHADGILIDRTIGADIAATLKANIPGVVQVPEKGSSSTSGE